MHLIYPYGLWTEIEYLIGTLKEQVFVNLYVKSEMKM